MPSASSEKSPVPFSAPARGRIPAARHPWRHSLGDHAPRFRSGFETLRGLELFSPVSDGELVKFAALGCERRVEKGTSFRPGAGGGDAPLLALILEGEALLAWGRGADALLLRALEPGDLIGEIEMFDSLHFGWTGEAGGPGECGESLSFGNAVTRSLTTLRLMEWDRENVMEALRRWPDVALSLLGGMARRQRDLQRRVAGICNQRAPRRLARALTALAEDRGVVRRDETGRRRLLVRDPPSGTRLAELAGMARETVSRLLAQWERRGWIAGRRGGAMVLDEVQMRRLAGSGDAP